MMKRNHRGFVDFWANQFNCLRQSMCALTAANPRSHSPVTVVN